jgi:DNA-binding MarR family transcriptional regulator
MEEMQRGWRERGHVTAQDLTFLAVQRSFEHQFGLVTLTSEYELVCCLLDDEWFAPRDLQERVRLSAAAVRYTLAKMAGRGVVLVRDTPHDRRSVQYRLTDQMRTLVLEQYAGYLELARSAKASRRTALVPLNTYHNFIRKGRQVSHLTADFQILLYLYLAARLDNHEMSQFIDVSQAKFNQSLARLRSLGLIEVTPDPDDGRRKLYDLADPVRVALERLHDEVARWLDQQRPAALAASAATA